MRASSRSHARCGSMASSSGSSIARLGSSLHKVLADSATKPNTMSAWVRSPRCRPSNFACSKHQASSRGTVSVRVRSSASASRVSPSFDAPCRSSRSFSISRTVRPDAFASQNSASSGLATVAKSTAMLQLSEPEISASARTGRPSNRRAKVRACRVQLAERSQRSSAYASTDENPSAWCPPLRSSKSSPRPISKRKRPASPARRASSASSASTRSSEHVARCERSGRRRTRPASATLECAGASGCVNMVPLPYTHDPTRSQRPIARRSRPQTASKSISRQNARSVSPRRKNPRLWSQLDVSASFRRASRQAQREESTRSLCRSFREYVEAKARRSAFEGSRRVHVACAPECGENRLSSPRQDENYTLTTGPALCKAGVELPDDAVRLYAFSISPDSKNWVGFGLKQYAVAFVARAS
jgi:hypothetical protein